MDLPGKLGYSILGDESIQFVRSPREFIEKKCKEHGQVFQCRMLNKPHVLLTSNSAAQELLKEKWGSFSMGYKEYMAQLFDDNLLFLEGDSWNDLRKALEGVFSHKSVATSAQQTKDIISEYMSQIETDNSVVLYETLKELATRLSIALFLSTDIGGEDAREISHLMTTHWRGIISVPLPIRIPWSTWRSGFSKALTAKDKLLELIVEKLKSNPSNIAAGVGETCNERDAVARHLLLFVSALIPKAMASLLTSTVIELCKPQNLMWQDLISDDSKLEDIILEIQRLWPPFFGGRRICTEECEIAGYRIPEGFSVAYVSYFANRDSKVFPQPNTFRPERWTLENASDKDRVWTFGSGPRQCIGKVLSTTLLKQCIHQLHTHFLWELVPDQDLSYKMLPVSRPKEDIKVVLRTRHPTRSQTTI